MDSEVERTKETEKLVAVLLMVKQEKAAEMTAAVGGIKSLKKENPPAVEGGDEIARWRLARKE